MSILLDDSDARKAKRAVVVTSFFVIALSYVDLRSDEIEILSLKIGVSKEAIIIFGKLVLLYFLAMLLKTTGEESLDRLTGSSDKYLLQVLYNIEIRKEKLNNLVSSEQDLRSKLDHELSMLEQIEGWYRKDRTWTDTFTYIMDFVVPVLMAIVALSSVHLSIQNMLT